MLDQSDNAGNITGLSETPGSAYVASVRNGDDLVETVFAVTETVAKTLATDQVIGVTGGGAAALLSNSNLPGLSANGIIDAPTATSLNQRVSQTSANPTVTTVNLPSGTATVVNSTGSAGTQRSHRYLYPNNCNAVAVVMAQKQYVSRECST